MAVNPDGTLVANQAANLATNNESNHNAAKVGLVFHSNKCISISVFFAVISTTITEGKHDKMGLTCKQGALKFKKM